MRRIAARSWRRLAPRLVAGFALLLSLGLEQAPAWGQTGPTTTPPAQSPPALSGADFAIALRLAPFDPSELPVGFNEPKLVTMGVPPDFQAHNALSATRVELKGPDETDAIVYFSYPNEAEARGRFDSASPPSGLPLSGQPTPPDLAYPAKCLEYSAPQGTARRGKTDCFVLIGSVELLATTALVGDVQGGNRDGSFALARAGAAHLERVSANPPAPLGKIARDEGRNHIPTGSPLQFGSNPPSSGSHYPNWTQPGVYTEPQSPGNWVHSLEHGYIVLLYNCPSECPELVKQLQQFYEAAPKSERYGYQKLVVTPYQPMDHRLAIVAWGRVDELDELDPERLLAFYRAYHDAGPEDVG